MLHRGVVARREGILLPESVTSVCAMATDWSKTRRSSFAANHPGRKIGASVGGGLQKGRARTTAVAVQVASAGLRRGLEVSRLLSSMLKRAVHRTQG